MNIDERGENTMEKLTLQNLETALWSCADILRGELSAAEYKDYIFGLLFLKRLNDEFDEERGFREKEFVEQGMVEEEVEMLLNDSSIYETFYVPESERWSKLKSLNLNVGPELDKAFKSLEDEPKNAELIGVLSTANYLWLSIERVPDKKLSQLLLVLDTINLANPNLESEDILGDAYQYLIKQFADEGGKKGGEFYIWLKHIVYNLYNYIYKIIYFFYIIELDSILRGGVYIGE